MLNFIKQIILEAGDLVKEYYYSDDLKIENKSEKDLVTEADKACEEFLIKKIKAEFPGHEILGEEGIAETTTEDVLNMMKNSPTTELEKEAAAPIDTNVELEELPLQNYKWIIDPIDGTTNFAHRVPIFAISIGLEKNGEIIAGAIYNPITGELFSAEKGGGAYLEMIGATGIKTEPKRLQVSKMDSHRALLATGFHPGYPEMFEKNIEFFKKIMHASHTVRRLGAAAIDLAYVAAGYFEGFWELKLNPWDVAAGALLVTEAGGHITHIDGSPYSIYNQNILATNGHIHEEMVKQLNS